MFWSLYFISIADSVANTFTILGWILLIAFGVTLLTLKILYWMEYENNEEANNIDNAVKKFKNKIGIPIIAIVLIFIGAFIPSTKQLYIIYGITKFSESKVFEQTNEVASKSLKLLNKQLDKYLEDTKEENKK